MKDDWHLYAMNTEIYPLGSQVKIENHVHSSINKKNSLGRIPILWAIS